MQQMETTFYTVHARENQHGQVQSFFQQFFFFQQYERGVSWPISPCNLGDVQL